MAMKDIADELQAIIATPGDQPFTVAAFRAARETLRHASRLATVQPMTTEKLAEIEAQIGRSCISAEGFNCTCRLHNAAIDLLAEVRRLRRENHLMSLSRGTPSVVGAD